MVEFILILFLLGFIMYVASVLTDLFTLTIKFFCKILLMCFDIAQIFAEQMVLVCNKIGSYIIDKFKRDN